MPQLHGLAAKSGKTPKDFDPRAVAKGTKVEMEHTDKPRVAATIAADHLTEDRAYYEKLERMEKKASVFDYAFSPFAMIAAARAAEEFVRR